MTRADSRTARDAKAVMPAEAFHYNDVVRVPLIALAQLLDAGPASACAAHLLAISVAHGIGFTLNEHHVRKKYAIGSRRFAACEPACNFDPCSGVIGAQF